uniref:Helicase ATP-binding domain-containing protein n=1 Tax=Magallana gigas TaxID=29159 RepID=A0A8W8P2K3_MAGGI
MLSGTLTQPNSLLPTSYFAHRYHKKKQQEEEAGIKRRNICHYRSTLGDRDQSDHCCGSIYKGKDLLIPTEHYCRAFDKIREGIHRGRGTNYYYRIKNRYWRVDYLREFTFVYPSATIIVTTALVWIMKEQTQRLCKLGFKATYIGRDPTEDDAIIEGIFKSIFASPEALVGDRKWRDVVANLRDRIKVIVVDEAHTVVQW